MDRDTEPDRAGLRILRFLAGGEARLRPAAAQRLLLLEAGVRGTMAAEPAVLTALERRALIARRNETLRIRAAGRTLLAGIAARRRDMLLAQPPEPCAATVETEDGRETVTVNGSESPLALLHRRKGKDGRPFIDGREFLAGERLRADYGRGRIMPRLGVNWDAVGSGGRRRGGPGGAGELNDAALAARRRVEKAIEAVGPELSGVLVDICCFLKGMEQVEAERGWPARSAKVVLKSALGALARHYEPPRGQARGNAPAALHWGTDDYRPALTLS
jgi:hypothetical protein